MADRRRAGRTKPDAARSVQPWLLPMLIAGLWAHFAPAGASSPIAGWIVAAVILGLWVGVFVWITVLAVRRLAATLPTRRRKGECASCGYALAGLGYEGRCPECGEPFSGEQDALPPTQA